MEFHPIANIFALLPEPELNALADDIRQHGLFKPIITYEGMILDGRNRWLACQKARVEPRLINFDGSRSEALTLVWSANFHRRHLNPGQAAIAEAKRAKLDSEYGSEVEKLKAEAQDRVLAGKPNPTKLVLGGSRTERETNTIRARAVGTNQRYLTAAEGLLETRPEVLAPVETGEKTLSQVMREVKREETLERIATLPSEKYRVIYADPPWTYGTGGGVNTLDSYGGATKHYPTMTMEQLCALPIANICDANAVLFMWVTSPLLDEVWPVIKAWGFEYKATWVWDKVKHNFGHYQSVRHEFLLQCTRGSCPPDISTLLDSVVSIERSETHSEKPVAFRTMIDTLYPHGKRIELFARGEVPEGWSTYGTEC